VLIPFLAYHFPRAPKTIQQIYLSITAPFIHRTDSTIVSFKDFFYRILLSNQIIQENKVLKKEIDVLKKDLVDYAELEDENQRLKDIVSFKKSLPQKMVPARVVGRDLASWRRSIVIDKGEKDGLKEDFAVVSSYGLVGRIIEVGESASRVMLLTDMDFKISAIIQHGREEGIVEGVGEAYCWMKYVEREGFVQNNDIVISSGLGGVFPKGIIIGGISSVSVGEDMLFKRIKIVPAVKFSKLEEVLVIIK